MPCKCVWSTRSEEIENVCIDFSGFPSPHIDSIMGLQRRTQSLKVKARYYSISNDIV